jgi:hypothetical protein
MFADARKFQALPGIAIWAILIADADGSLAEAADRDIECAPTPPKKKQR